METTLIKQIYNYFLDLAYEDYLFELIEVELTKLYDEYKNNNSNWKH